MSGGSQDYRYGAGQASGGAGGAGYAVDHVAMPAQQPRFEGIAESYANIPNDLYKAVMRLRALADRYGGPQPEAVSKSGGIAGEPSSLVARMEANAGAIRDLCAQLHAQLDRLERF